MEVEVDVCDAVPVQHLRNRGAEVLWERLDLHTLGRQFDKTCRTAGGGGIGCCSGAAGAATAAASHQRIDVRAGG